MQQTPLTVSQVNNYIKKLIDGDALLSQIIIKGELSNYTIHSSGHHYFTLKDDGGVISAVMFRGEASKLRFRPQGGMKVIIFGRVSVFPKSGQYQIYCSEMQPDGIGSLFIAFEQLKKKLQEEGLFDPKYKKSLPKYPKKIALITSPTGAAVRDMIRVLNHRFALTDILVCPVKVQGQGAAEEIASMIGYVNEHSLADLIITGRGGGSIEDLWAFNEEVVARAVFASHIPIISAVGHEPDVTICDFAADVRAATPSNGAEIAVQDSRHVKVQLGNARALLTKLATSKIDREKSRLKAISQRKIMSSPFEYLNERKMLLAMLSQQLEGAQTRIIHKKRMAFAAFSASLDALSPLKVLSRGYSVASHNGEIIKSTNQLKPQDNIILKLSDGQVSAIVDEIKET